MSDKSISRRHFLFSMAAAAGLISKAGAYNRKEFPELTEQPEIYLCKFEDYAPANPQTNRIYITDRALQDLLRLDKYHLTHKTKPGFFQIEFDQNPLKVRSPEEFEKAVIEDAEACGIDRLFSLNPRESVIAACRLVAHKLSYGPSDFWKGKYDLISPDIVYTKMPTKAVCRHYTAITKAVFELMKKYNPNLSETYMTQYFGILKHAFNQVATVSRDDNKINILLTFVDPTFWDNGGKLNALDEIHLGKGLRDLETLLTILRKRNLRIKHI